MVDKGYSCDYTSFGWVAVKAYPGDYTWEQAKTKCSQDGTNDFKAQLAAPRSSVENEWFVNKANELGVDEFWLGITDKDREDTWKTQHGLPQNYFNWDSDLFGQQPSNAGGNEDCVLTNGRWGFNWNDETCTSKKNLLCTRIQGKSLYPKQAG